ncbi:hypothetical protein A2574_00595 [Candidatus Shapirobacteria bacterium RIFOXYD1_FULL_38_32]|uniref:Uncharacterized protein n=2 Tax=Candidatus Shapironibacteriota TaxID=1752721 RepID=A0A1F7SPX6_9BACT|nr:MAG: hypothetical protein A2367_02465 [Candidatus Shapirobacteria bacterium RIFOXYB1_FULL_38_38]OGL55898.1 MAG: hypothetical protein A2195_03105 [Candidatus Shapirobacteria bacterium RIFOXYA1_FULL_39_17]OGL56851.1 MAG: hypothetical protein A2410_03935 [Candidatus Shapirobacteria bacterium RIFOXYC1_FULL_38_24]OGL57335.1 MAG: hypothetical protein A2574_00595 [Candidatus Shapirobacteria bacterium RIFOXYD1_FULL_38_32]HAP37793.1 hypothetical protein [Candidatus Shapirobacteria bacterium]
MNRQQVHERMVHLTDKLLYLNKDELLVFNQIHGRQKTPDVSQISAELMILPRVVEKSLMQLRGSRLLSNEPDLEFTKDGEDAAVLAPLIIRLRFEENRED